MNLGDDTDDEPDREDGPNPGEGWWLEEKTRTAILDLEEVEVDEIELYVTIATLEVDIALKTPIDGRYVIECKDWRAGTISPHDIFRLAAVANRANAHPLLVHIEDTEITDRADRLCNELNIPRLTFDDLTSDSRKALPKKNQKIAREMLNTPKTKKWSDMPDIFDTTEWEDRRAYYVNNEP